MKAYCFKCKQKREMKNPTPVVLKNGRRAAQGICPICGGKLSRMEKGS